MDFVELLQRVSLFSLMSRGDLKRLAKLCQEHNFNDGEVITREGDLDGRLFVVAEGRVKVVKDLDGPNAREVAVLGANSHFGELALVDDFRRTASVVAEGPARVVSLDQWNFRDTIKKYPSVAVELMQSLARRLRNVEAQHC